MSCRSRDHAVLMTYVALALLCCSLVLAAQTRSQSQRLQDAIRLLETQGDYLGAIVILQEVAKGPDRAVAAQALLQLGTAYEKLGRDGARQVYESLLKYTDQPQLVVEAQARLARLAAAGQREAATGATHVLETQGFSIQGPLSPDGKWFPGFDWNTYELGLLDAATLQPQTVVTSELTGGGLPSAAAVSADGLRIAYGWSTSSVSNGQAGEIRVIGVKGAGKRTVVSEKDAAFDVVGWSPDGRYVFAARGHDDGTSDLLMVAVETGVLTELKHLSSTPLGVSLSPDGGRLAYDLPQGPGDANRDIAILDVETRRERLVVRHPMNDTYPVWHPDGHRLLFVSDRTGEPALWMLANADETAAGEPLFIRGNMGRIEARAVSAAGSVYLGLWAGFVDVYVSSLDRATGRWSAPATVARKIVGDNYFSAWSPDSRRIVLVSRRAGQRVFDRGTHMLVLHDIVTGDEHELTPDLSGGVSWPAWSPDGSSLMVVSNSQHGLYRVDAATGAVSTLVERDPTQGIFSRPAWMPDGRQILFNYGSKLWLRNLDTRQERVPYEPPAGGTAFNVVPSPDGRMLAVATVGKLPERFIQVGSIDGGPFRTVMTVPSPEWLEIAGWTPNGLEVVVARTTVVGGKQQGALWSVPVAGGAPRALGIAMERLRDARLSPDGQHVSFTAGVSVYETRVLENALPASPAIKR